MSSDEHSAEIRLLREQIENLRSDVESMSELLVHFLEKSQTSILAKCDKSVQCTFIATEQLSGKPSGEIGALTEESDQLLRMLTVLHQERSGKMASPTK